MTVAMAITSFEVSRGGRKVISIPDLAIEKGEVLALLGPNGAGKSTLIHALGLLVKPVSGALRFGSDLVTRSSNLTTLRRRMAVVLQDPHLFDTTVRRNVASGLNFRGLDNASVDRRVDEALELFGISNLHDRAARTLSGGEAARVSLARSFVLEPEIMMLDEPFSSLDPPTREALIGDVESILAKRGTTTVMSTHDATEAIRMADRIAVMNEGRIEQIGSSTDVRLHPQTGFVARFMGTETILVGKVVESSGSDTRVRVGEREIFTSQEGAAGDDVLVCIRAENVTLADGAVPGDAANAFEGTVTKITPLGSHTRVHLDCGFDLASLVTDDQLRDLCIEIGTSLTATLGLRSIHISTTRSGD